MTFLPSTAEPETNIILVQNRWRGPYLLAWLPEGLYYDLLS